jgi:phytoene dehydrogenase-like protein
MTHYALDIDPDIIGGVERQTAQLMLLPTDLTKFRQYFTDMRFGRVPYPEKLMAVLPNRVDPSRAPEGKAVLYLWQFVPYFLADGGPQKWDEIKDSVSETAFKRFAEFTTNITEENILGKYVISPLDYERNNKNMINAQVLGPSPALYQYMSFRPTPELGQYRTPIKGLYLSGQSMHPGGGLTMGGRATAQIIMQDLGIDFDDLF